MIIGMSTETKVCQIHGPNSQDLHYWTKLLQEDICCPGETDQNPNDLTSRSHMAWRLDKNWKSRAKKRETIMGNRETKTRICPKVERNLFHWSEWWSVQRHHIKMQGGSQRHQWQLQCNAKERSPNLAYGKPLFLKQKKPRHLKRKTRFSCTTEANESTRQRIESVSKRIHEEHIAKKGQNSVVHYNLFARQLKPREGPKVTLRNTWVYTSSNVLRELRETESKLQIWDSDPIPSESRSWPDEDANIFWI